MKFKIYKASTKSIFDDRLPSKPERVQNEKFSAYVIEVNTLDELLRITDIDDIIIERNCYRPSEDFPTHTIVIYDDYIE